MANTLRGYLTTFLVSVLIITTEQKHRNNPTDEATTPSEHEAPVNPDIDDIIRTKVAVLMPMLDDDKIRGDEAFTLDNKKMRGDNVRVDRNRKDESEENTETDSESYESTDDDTDTVTNFRDGESNTEVSSESNTDTDSDSEDVGSDSNTVNKTPLLSNGAQNSAGTYKKLRNEIGKLLKIEPISEDTKTYVNEALDKITKELSSPNCVWRKNALRKTRMRTDNELPSIVIPENMTQTVMKEIKEKWDQITNQYFLDMGNDTKDDNEKVRQAAFLFLTRLRHFVFNANEDYKKLRKQYAIKCKFDKDFVIETGVTEKVTEETAGQAGANDEVQQTTAKILDETKMLRVGNYEEGECNVTICSAELAEYLTDFYHQINETQYEIFKNYIEMFLREIDTDNKQKENFSRLLKHINKYVEKNAKKRFAKETAELGLIPNFASARIGVLRRFVDKTIENVKELIKATLYEKLKKLPLKLRLVVRRDIQATADIELGNLQDDYKNKICDVFQSCNGEGAGRKYIQNKHKTNHVQIKLKDTKKTLQSIIDKLNKLKAKERDDFDDLENYIYHRNNPENVNLRKINTEIKPPPYDINKYKDVKVTRTTTYNKGFINKGTTRRLNNDI